MNFIFISPHFPTNFWNFVDRLHRNGVNVLGIGDTPYENLRQELRESLTEYYRVDSMEDYSEMFRAVAFFSFKYGKIDWIESNNEYWLEQDARLRSDFNICTGLKAEEIARYKNKSGMKAYYEAAGVPVARYILVEDKAEAEEFIAQVGWPVVAKPDCGVGASDTWKIKNETDLNVFLAHRTRGVQYIMEEFIDGEVATFDGISGRSAEVLYATSHVSPGSIMDMVNEHTPVWYYVDKEIDPKLRAAGEATIKAFDARNRFFHCEFFRLRSDKEGVGKKGDIMALEVNMRPAGGYTVDMENFAGSIDLYQLWADMVAFGKSVHPFKPKMQYCACASRRDSMEYREGVEALLVKYRENLKLVTRLPDALSECMGNQMYIANFDSKAEMDAFGEFVHAPKPKEKPKAVCAPKAAAKPAAKKRAAAKPKVKA